MRDINKVILIGRLGADPIQRHTKTGIAVTQFSVATTRKTSKEDPSPESESPAPSTPSPALSEETQWHRIVAWGKLGEICFQYLKKGNPVYVEGSIRSHQYEDKEGKNRTSFEIYLENISFLGSRRIDGSGAQLSAESVIPAPAIASVVA